MLKKRTFGLIIGLVTMGLSAGSAFAKFGEESARVWSQRSLRLYEAAYIQVEKPTDISKMDGISKAYFDKIQEACSGITGEHIQYGGANMPVWAQTAQGSFCGGARQMWGTLKAAKGKDKKYCTNLKAALSNAKKAKRGVDPDIVVDAAEKLILATESLLKAELDIVRTSAFFPDHHNRFSCT